MSSEASSRFTLFDRLLEHFRSGEYSGNRRANTDIICTSVGGDLLDESEVLVEAAETSKLVAQRNFTPPGNRFYQDIDYVIGSPDAGVQSTLSNGSEFKESSVDDVWFALNAESLISSVSNNWKNRGKDIHSFYLGVYDVAPMAATGSVIVLNVNDLDRNPTDIIDGYREFDFANGSLAQSLDSLAVVPIEYDESAPEEAAIADGLIEADDELHYSTFIETIAVSIERRFRGEFQVSPDSVEAVLARQESDILEFKAELPDHLGNLSKKVAGLANHEGGALLLGVDDDGSLVGLDDIDAIEERVSGALRKELAGVVTNIRKATVDGEDILIINVRRTSSAPVDVDGRFYIRAGTTTDKLTGREIVDRFPR